MNLSKNVKKLGALVLCASLLSGVPNSASAVENDIPSEVVVFDGTVYQPTTTKTNVKIPQWTHIATNSSTVTDQVTYNVSRRIFATGTVSGEAEFKILQKGVKVTAETSLGMDYTRSTTMVFNIPPKSTQKLVYGSIGVNTVGRMVRYANGIVSSSKAVAADYSRYSYSSNQAY